MSDAPKPQLTERDLSYHVALAGAEAKDEAADLGGDAAQLRGLVAAARLEPAPNVVTAGNGKGMLKGMPLRQDDLLVTLCLNLYTAIFGADPCHQVAGFEVKEAQGTHGETFRTMVHVAKTPENEAAKMQAIAALGYIFTQPEDAWELLDLAKDNTVEADVRRDAKRDFCRASLDFAGSFTQSETDTLIAHVAKLMRRVPESEYTPGKQGGPAS